nr:carboxypeptidase regulatory-like domain-containing protein [Alistipes sp.]
MKRLLLIVALLLVVAVSTAQVTTSAIRGQVTTNDNPLPGATIVALHTPSGSQYSTTTNGEGYYTISGMRIGGPYEITISFLGYDTVKVAGFALALGETAVYDFTLNEQSIDLEEVYVVGGSSHSKEGYYNRTQMEKIPSIDRSIYDLTNILSSAVSPASGGIILGGQSTRYNAFSIDGSPAADIYGLGTTGMTGSLTRANPIPIDALDAVTITTSTVDVRLSGFTGGSIDAVTRSGSNDFRGSAYTYFNNEHFWGSTPGRNIASRTRLSEQMTNIVGVTLGGPIIKNKLHFFVAGEFNRTTTPSSHHPGSASSAITIDEAEQISERYEALTGYDGGGWKEHQVKDITGAAVARIDWNINDHNHLSVRYNMLNADAAASSNSAQSFYFTGAEYTNISRTHSLVAELNSSKQSRRGTMVENSLRAGYTRLKDGRTT